MKNRLIVRNLVALVFVAMLAAACGPTSSDLPVNDEAGDQILVPSAACVEGEPDCVDTVVEGEPLPLPPADGPTDGDASGTCLAGEPDCADDPSLPPAQPLPDPGANPSDGLDRMITVTDAIAGNIQGIAVGEPFPVSGVLVVVDGEARLCDVMAESYPPQCGGDASLLIDGDVSEFITSSEGNVGWNDGLVVLLAESVSDGVLVIADTEN